MEIPEKRKLTKKQLEHIDSKLPNVGCTFGIPKYLRFFIEKRNMEDGNEYMKEYYKYHSNEFEEFLLKIEKKEIRDYLRMWLKK
ncbi:MAG: hypothetical protein ACFFDF_14190 [Candidatus Odinarchaeota archaeon]